MHIDQLYLIKKTEELGNLVSNEFEKIVRPHDDVFPLYDGIWYAIGSKGKKLRPTICLLACQTLGGNINKALAVATAFEMLHNFILVHDDIEDHDTVRRNQPTVWVKYGLEHAVNMGDVMLAEVYQAILRSKKTGLSSNLILRLVELVTETMIETGEGQALDIESRSKDEITEEQYMQIVTKKTGRYLVAPIIGGAIVANADEKLIRTIEKFGKCAGPVFQMRDDILDMTIGKGRGEIGCDIKEGKRSFLVTYVASKCTLEERKRLYEILNTRREEKSENDVNWVIDLFKKYRAVDHATRKIDALVIQAKRAITNLPVELRNLLSAFIDFSAYRET
jgi:geranylgeranyl pyrophosphate synthase